MNVNRRQSLSALAGAVGAVILGTSRAKAQFTEQEVRNGADIVSTGDVNLSQSASGSQEATFGVYVDGELVTQDGIYQSSTGQIVVNDGRIVSTGDVNVSQSASGTQSVSTVVFPTRDGEPADYCDPGAVVGNPNTGQLFYQGYDCCWYAACANRCQQNACEGNHCG